MSENTVATSFLGRGQRRRTASLKVMLFACTGVLSVVLVAGFGWSAIEAAQRFQAARQLQAFDKGANMFISGLFQIVLERLYTNNGLQAEAPAGTALKNDIDASRQAIAANFKPGLAILQGFDFPNKPELTAALDAALSNADRLRAGADTALTLPRGQRDPGVLKDFIPGMTGWVNAALKLWYSALHRATQDDPMLARLATIKDIGWQMRDFSGRERSAVSQAIASAQPVPTNLPTDAASLRARVDVLWQELEHLTSDPVAHPAIRQAMAAAKEQYFGAFLRLDDDLLARGTSGAGYGITAGDYVAKTTPYIGSLLNVVYAADLASEDYSEDLAARARMALIVSSSIALFGILMAAATMAIIARRVTTPLKTMTTVMQALAANDTTVDVPARDRGDEIGAMARSVQVFKQTMIDASHMRAGQEATKRMAEEERHRNMVELTAKFESSFGGIVESVAAAATGLQTTAEFMADTSDETRRQSGSVAAAAEQATENVQMVATAAEQLTASIGEISQQIGRAGRIIQDGVRQTTVSNELVQGLARIAENIGGVVQIIANIAGQTNLLALNATIEAARAGEAGRGFAVVASEVKVLATQTTKATAEIAAQIKAIQEATQAAAQSIDGVTDIIARVNEAASAIAAAVEEQGAATQAISRNVLEAARGTREVSSNIANVSAAAQQSGDAATEVLVSAAGLGKNGDRLKAQVENFLQQMRAG